MSADTAQPCRAESLWHGMAAEYLDDGYDVRNDPRDVARIKRELIARYARRSDVACDAGCANGAWLEFLAPRVKCVIGVDRSAGMLRLAHARGARTPDQNVCLVEADLRTLAIADRTFDLILCFSTLSIVPEWEAVLGEICRVLKHGGRLVLDLQGRHNLAHHYWSRWHRRGGRFGSTALSWSELEAAIARHGLALIEARALGVLSQAQFVPGLRYGLALRRFLPTTPLHSLRLDERLSSIPRLRPFAGRWLLALARSPA